VKNRKFVASGARPCRRLRERLFKFGVAGLPPSWRRSWLVQRIRATPTWADFKEIRAVYRRAAELTESTGEKWNVDHIVPLQHPMVCGLHVAWNLRPIRERLNQAKGNEWNPNQPDLFARRRCDVQLALFEDQP
jgi:hypothetical protein